MLTPNLFTSANPKHTLLSDVILRRTTFCQPMSSPSGPCNAPWFSSETGAIPYSLHIPAGILTLWHGFSHGISHSRAHLYSLDPQFAGIWKLSWAKSSTEAQRTAVLSQQNVMIDIYCLYIYSLIQNIR